MTAVTNSGPLIVLAKINHLHLLHALYGNVLVSQTVYHETVVTGRTRGYQDADAIQVFLNNVGWLPTALTEIPLELTGDIRLGRGECEAIALALKHQALLLIDEVHARTVAKRLGLHTVGSLGILVEAYRKGSLTSGMLTELLNIIESREDIWVHPDLCRRMRRQILDK